MLLTNDFEILVTSIKSTKENEHAEITRTSLEEHNDYVYDF